jgi:50S ribosomal protein L4
VVPSGELTVDKDYYERAWPFVPAVGFNAILELPMIQFEVFEGNDAEDMGKVVLPNDMFGLPIRKDVIHEVYWSHRRALAGYREEMQLYKWEWPGSNKKVRRQQRSGKARMGRRKAPGKYEGAKAKAIKPKDMRKKMLRKKIYLAFRSMLSAKYVQGQLHVVDSFRVNSHKTKHVVAHLRRIVGYTCNSCLLVHEGERDVNDNFRWATAHISAVRRENVEGLNTYLLLKYRQVIFTETALQKLIHEVQTYPEKLGWLPRYATPTNEPAPRPDKVPGWCKEWAERKDELKKTEFRAKAFFDTAKQWKWSHELKGPLKVRRYDPLKGFRLKDFSLYPSKAPWEKFEVADLYADEQPLDLVYEPPALGVLDGADDED